MLAAHELHSGLQGFSGGARRRAVLGGERGDELVQARYRLARGTIPVRAQFFLIQVAPERGELGLALPPVVVAGGADVAICPGSGRGGGGDGLILFFVGARFDQRDAEAPELQEWPEHSETEPNRSDARHRACRAQPGLIDCVKILGEGNPLLYVGGHAGGGLYRAAHAVAHRTELGFQKAHEDVLHRGFFLGVRTEVLANGLHRLRFQVEFLEFLVETRVVHVILRAFGRRRNVAGMLVHELDRQAAGANLAVEVLVGNEPVLELQRADGDAGLFSADAVFVERFDRERVDAHELLVADEVVQHDLNLENVLFPVRSVDAYGGGNADDGHVSSPWMLAETGSRAAERMERPRRRRVGFAGERGSAPGVAVRKRRYGLYSDDTRNSPSSLAHFFD
ncbi:MAG: hypothetical protein R2748_31395 [Bryobacterales bacterium]